MAARRWMVLALVLSACGSDFDPPSYLKDLRVLAFDSDRLDVGPGESITLRPRIFTPNGIDVSSVTWSFCPLAADATLAFRCIDPRCETPLSPSADGSVTAEPLALAQACAATLAGDGEGGDAPAPEDLPRTIDTVFRLVVTSSDGDREEVIQRVPLWPFETPPARNRPVGIRSVTVNGSPSDARGVFAAVAPEEKVTIEVEIEPDSLDTYADSTGRVFQEDPVVSFYATAGRFDRDRANGLLASVPWKAEKLAESDTEAVLYVVARDLRGGQTLVGPLVIPIRR